MQGIAPALIFAIPANCLPNSGTSQFPQLLELSQADSVFQGFVHGGGFGLGAGHRHNLFHDVIPDVDCDTHVIRFLDKVMIP